MIRSRIQTTSLAKSGNTTMFARSAFHQVRRNERHGQRALLLSVIALVVLTIPNGIQITLDAMSEAYLAVAVFVAGTLMLVLAAERSLETDLGVWLDQKRSLQVPFATLLGAFPGCGGAIIVVTQFTRGYLSFGSIVATLTATMGDAMFLFLAKEPNTALLVLGISMVTGTISGYVVDAIHKPSFLRPKKGQDPGFTKTNPLKQRHPAWRATSMAWLVLVVPGMVLGVIGAFQIDADGYFMDVLGVPAAHWLGIAGALLGLFMWVANDGGQSVLVGEARGEATDRRPFLPAVIATTNFILAWVVLAFVGFEALVSVGGIDLAQVLLVWSPIVPFLAILVGFVPGCGPQILVTSLYLSGMIPLSAQLGNAIANDGDALFPALIIAPKAALVATLYSAIPAVIVAYGFYFFWEMAA